MSCGVRRFLTRLLGGQQQASTTNAPHGRDEEQDVDGNVDYRGHHAADPVGTLGNFHRVVDRGNVDAAGLEPNRGDGAEGGHDHLVNPGEEVDLGRGDNRMRCTNRGETMRQGARTRARKAGPRYMERYVETPRRESREG